VALAVTEDGLVAVNEETSIVLRDLRNLNAKPAERIENGIPIDFLIAGHSFLAGLGSDGILHVWSRSPGARSEEIVLRRIAGSNEDVSSITITRDMNFLAFSKQLSGTNLQYIELHILQAQQLLTAVCTQLKEMAATLPEYRQTCAGMVARRSAEVRP
jgi:hypothetical protein